MIHKWIVTYWNGCSFQAIKVESDTLNLMMILSNNGIILDNIINIAKEVEITDMTMPAYTPIPFTGTITTNNTDEIIVDNGQITDVFNKL